MESIVTGTAGLKQAKKIIIPTRKNTKTETGTKLNISKYYEPLPKYA